MPVSDTSARLAAAWLAAWREAGLLGTDPEVVGFVEDLIQFVGERTMEEEPGNLDEWRRGSYSRLLARARELEAEVARLRAAVKDVRGMSRAALGFDRERMQTTLSAVAVRCDMVAGGAE